MEAEPNAGLARIYQELGVHYELDNDSTRATVFNAAADTVASLTEPLLDAEELRQYHGIGKSTIEVAQQYLAGAIPPRLTQLRVKHPALQTAVDELLPVHGIGVKTAYKLYLQGYHTRAALLAAATQGDVELTHAQLVGLTYFDDIMTPIPRAEMDEIRDVLTSYMPGLVFELAGSYRRGKPSSGDVDVLVQAGVLSMADLILQLSPILAETLAIGETKYMGLLDSVVKHRIDIRMVTPDAWACALLYFTGSWQFNKAMRLHAIQMGYLLNEYGLYSALLNMFYLYTYSEEEVFALLELEYVRPEDR